MPYLAVSDIFEYLCYGSTTIINIFIRQDQILTSKDGPRTERVKHCLTYTFLNSAIPRLKKNIVNLAADLSWYYQWRYFIY